MILVTTYYYKKKYGTGSFDYNLRALEKKHLVARRKKISTERVREKKVRCFTVADTFPNNLSGLREKEKIERLLLPLVGKTMISSEFAQKTGLSPVGFEKLPTL